MLRAPITDVAAITEMAHADLKMLRGAHIFMTGGTGYIGRWLLESLCHANHALNLHLDVTVLSRQPRAFAERHPHLSGNPAVTLLRGDIRNFHCEQHGFTHVIHAATDIIGHTHPLETFDVTVQGTRRVLEFARHQNVRNVLLLSSGSVYGALPDVVERAPEILPCVVDVTTSRTAYGLGKIATEWLGNTYGKEYGFSCKSARIFAQIGPYLALDAHFAVGNFIRDALRGKPILITGDGTSLRSYMYATDLVTWLWAILIRGHAGCAYNVGSELSISIKKLAEMVVRISNDQKFTPHITGQTKLGMAPSRYIPDTTLARNTLGLAISIPIDEAIKRTAAWYRAQLTHRS